MRIVAISFFAVSLLVLGGCKASPPSTAERVVMDEAKREIFIPNKEVRNPLPEKPETVANGKTVFSQYCLVCHGLDGQNTGVPFADRMSPPVPSLASSDIQQYTDGQLKWVIENGIRPSGMPAAKDMLSDDDMWSIVQYIRHLPPAGSLGEPEMYSH